MIVIAALPQALYGRGEASLHSESPRVRFQPTRMIWVARGGLAACIAITAVFAFSPPKAGLHVFSWDKADHFCAFFATTTAAIVSFPRQRLAWIALWASLAGASIELIQGLPFVHRDCDFWDWVADNIGIGAVIGLMIAAQLRLWLATGGLLIARTGLTKAEPANGRHDLVPTGHGSPEDR